MQQSLAKILGILETGQVKKTPAVVQDPDRTTSGENLAAANSARTAPSASIDIEDDGTPPPKAKKHPKTFPLVDDAAFVLGSTAAGGILT